MRGALMSICIYSKKLNETFKSGEHVVPAFLGGIRKLPKGYVSDQTNKYFSSMEYQLAHYSGLSYLRSMYGPGKRGMLEYESYPLIAYSFAGESYLVIKSKNKISYLQQMIVTFDDDGYSVISYGSGTGTKQEDYKMTISLMKLFQQKADTFSEEFIEDAMAKNNRIIIALHENRWYLSSKIRISILDIKERLSKSKVTPFSDKYMRVPLAETLSIGKICQDNPKTYRSLAKVIMNTYALFYGKETILEERFDKLRDYIYFGNNSDVMENSINAVIDVRKFINDYSLQSDCHLVMIFKYQGSVYGFESFYGGQYAFLLKISNEIKNETAIKIFVTEWKSRSERVVDETIANIDLYIIPHDRASKSEKLISDRVFDRTLSNKTGNLISKLLSNPYVSEIIAEYKSQEYGYYSQIEFDYQAKKIIIYLNWLLPDIEFDNVIYQSLLFIDTYKNKPIQVAYPSNSKNDGEAYLAALLNTLTSFTLQDSHAIELEYNPDFMYNIRFGQIITRIINYTAEQLNEEYIRARLSIEMACLLLYNKDYESEFRVLVGDLNMAIVDNAKWISDRCRNLPLGNTKEKIFAITDIVNFLRIESHIKIESYGFEIK